jgi:hypothetical protein
MRSLFCENLRSESFPYFDWKFVKRRDCRDKGDTRRPRDSEIELFSHPVIRNISYPIGKTGRAFNVWFRFRRVRAQESFGQRLGDERARSNFRLKITFRMKPRESEVYSESRYPQIGGQRARGGKPGRVIVEASRDQFIANLAVKLLMKRFGGTAIEPNHFKSHDRMATPLFRT